MFYDSFLVAGFKMVLISVNGSKKRLYLDLKNGEEESFLVRRPADEKGLGNLFAQFNTC